MRDQSPTSAARAARPATAADTQPAPLGDLSDLQSGLRAIEDYGRTSPRDDWDPDYVVSRLGKDAARIAEWVRDSTLWIPYHGVLRGAAGVLMDRRGNSLDRALLLATLLERAGGSVRLAQTRLTYREAADLLPYLAARHPRLPAPSVTDPRPQALAVRYPSLGSREHSLARAAAELSARVDNQSTRLLRELGPRSPEAERGSRVGEALEGLRDHWWVQLLDGDTWRDVDVQARPGGAAAVARSPERTLPLADVPRIAPYHEIIVRVIGERWAGQGRSERTVIEYRLRPADLIGTPIVLQFWPTAWVEIGRPPASGNPRARLLETNEWSTMLLVGGDVVAGGILDASGDDPDVAPGGGIAGLGQGIASALGQESTAPTSALSAVWLEYEFQVPGDSARRTRREVFDLAGPALRAGPLQAFRPDEAARLTRALALTMRTELLPVACRLNPAFVSHLLTQSIRGTREMLQSGTAPNPEASMGAVVPTVSSLHALAAARFQWSRHGEVVHIDRPGLLTNHLYPAATEAGLAVVEATDIVANEIGVSLMVPDAVAVRVAQGILDTNAEALLLPGSAGLGNAGEAMAVPAEWVRIPPQGPAAADRLALPPDVRTRIADEVRSGWLVVAPGAPVPAGGAPFAGWWRIDPTSGHTLGLGANGWGQAVERGVQYSRSRVAMAMLKQAGKRFAGVFATTYGWCLLQLSVQRGEAAGLSGIKAAAVASPSECTGDAVFLGALAAFPLVALTVNMRFGAPPSPGGIPAPPEPAVGAPAAPAEGAPPAPKNPLATSGSPPAPPEPAPGQSPLATSGAPPEPAPGQSPSGTSGKNAPSPEPVPPEPPPAPRPLPEIEGDFKAAQGDLQAAQDRFTPLQDAFEAELAKAQNAGLPEPSHSDAYKEALTNKIDQMHRLDFLREEYVQAGGRLGAGGVPDGPMR